jgi:hypothetical protein
MLRPVLVWSFVTPMLPLNDFLFSFNLNYFCQFFGKLKERHTTIKKKFYSFFRNPHLLLISDETKMIKEGSMHLFNIKKKTISIKDASGASLSYTYDTRLQQYGQHFSLCKDSK